MSDAVLAVVPWAENAVETEEQQNQKDAGRQTQSGHPAGKEARGAESNKQTSAAQSDIMFTVCLFHI